MLIKLLALVNLVTFLLLASQHLFYFIALGRVQKGMGPAAYIELRHLLDRELATVLKALYYGTLFTTFVLTGAAFIGGHLLLGGTAAIALLLHIIDIMLALKGNIPLNTIIGGWKGNQFPDNWYKVREKWLFFYRIRQVVGIVALLLLLVGAVFG